MGAWEDTGSIKRFVLKEAGETAGVAGPSMERWIRIKKDGPR
jgi:hypothetical protein